MTIREGKWRCPYCAAVNRGADLACPGCGATRDKDVVFFLEDDAPEVADEALLKRAEAGADWLCGFCQTSNRPESTHCIQCGAERGTSPSRPVRDVPTPTPAPGPPATSGASWRGCGVVGLILALLATAFCAGALYFKFRKTSDLVTVSGFEWERTIAVEAYRSVRGEAWEGQVPPGAREVQRRQEVHHQDKVQTGTRKVKVGTKDMGNGFFKDVYEDRPVFTEHPVYKTKITYDQMRWVEDRKARASGQDHEPRWPEAARSASEREGARSERYVVVLEGGRKTYRFELPLARWTGLTPGGRFHAVIQGGSKVLELE